MQSSDPRDSAAASTIRPDYRPWYPWSVVAMLWFICFFNYADRQAISAILPSLEEEFGFSKSQQGMIAAAFMWVYALTAPLAGGVGDRTSRKLLILGGLYVWSIVTGFTAACTKLWQFVFVRGAEGLGETFYFPASMSMISDYHSPRTRSQAMGAHQTSVYVGTVGGSLFAGWMAEYYDWRYPFVILGAGGVLLGVVLAFFIREPLRNEAERLERGEFDQQPPPVSTASPSAEQGWLAASFATLLGVLVFFWALARNAPAMFLVAAFFWANLVAFIFITWLPSFLHEKYELDLASAAFLATIYIQFGSMVGSFTGGFLAGRWGQRRLGGRALVQAIGLFIGAPFVYWCGAASDLTTVGVALLCLGFGKGIYDSNIWASLYDVVPPERRSTAVGVTNMVGWFGAGAGTFAFGVVVDQGGSMSKTLSSLVVIYVAIGGLLVVSSLLTARRARTAG